jgi:hypothetical protein
MTRPIATAALALAMAATPMKAQETELERRSMSGPRLGLTMVTGRRADSLLDARGLNPLMSQFGWHFEQIVRPVGGGPMFVVQQVFMLGAVEQRLAIPSLTLLMGIRFTNGLEFGLGPNLLATGSRSEPVVTALAVGAGRSIDYGGVSIPLNLAVVHSPGATRFSVLVGYALRDR